MTQEEKQLLLVDLCGKLPYGVKVWYKYYPDNVIEKFATSIRLVDGKIALSSKFNREGDWYPVEETNELLIKPYLRPMSSMTEEEIVEFKWLNEKCDAMPTFEYVPVENYRIYNWLNAHHFDYRGLIEKGLALEAPEGMYKEK